VWDDEGMTARVGFTATDALVTVPSLLATDQAGAGERVVLAQPDGTQRAENLFEWVTTESPLGLPWEVWGFDNGTDAHYGNGVDTSLPVGLTYAVWGGASAGSKFVFQPFDVTGTKDVSLDYGKYIGGSNYGVSLGIFLGAAITGQQYTNADYDLGCLHIIQTQTQLQFYTSAEVLIWSRTLPVGTAPEEYNIYAYRVAANIYSLYENGALKATGAEPGNASNSGLMRMSRSTINHFRTLGYCEVTLWDRIPTDDELEYAANRIHPLPGTTVVTAVEIGPTTALRVLDHAGGGQRMETAMPDGTLEPVSNITWEKALGWLSMIGGSANTGAFYRAKHAQVSKLAGFTAVNDANGYMQMEAAGTSMTGTVFGQDRAGSAGVLAYTGFTRVFVGSVNNSVTWYFGIGSSEEANMSVNGWVFRQVVSELALAGTGQRMMTASAAGVHGAVSQVVWTGGWLQINGLDVAATSTNGIVARTFTGTFTARTITGTSGQINVTNGDGVSGNPTLALPNVGPGAGSVGAAASTLSITTDAQGRVTARTAQAIAIAESQVTGLVADLAGKVNDTGDTMTGALSIDVASGAMLTLKIAGVTKGLFTGDEFQASTVRGRGNASSFITSRNAANTATLDLLYLDAADKLILGGGTVPLETAGYVSIYGPVPGTPSAGQVLIGGGAIKAGGGITSESTAAGAVTSYGDIYLLKSASTDAQLLLQVSGFGSIQFGCNNSGATNGAGAPSGSMYVGSNGAFPLHLTQGGAPSLSFDAGRVATFASSVSCTALTVAAANYIYLRGDASTDGSVRFSSQSAGTMLIEKRASGSWVGIGSFA
jgi:hypothetical protein